MKIWRVVRTIKEEFEIEAETKQEALNLVSDPFRVTVLKETITAGASDYRKATELIEKHKKDA